MINGKWAITHASSLPAEALIEQMAAAGIAAEDVVLLDHESQVGKRLSYADTYIETLDQAEYDYEDLNAVLLLEQDEALESLLQHAECFVLSHYFQDDIQPVFAPTTTSELDWSKPQVVKLAGAELSTLLHIIQPIEEKYAFQSVEVTNAVSASFIGKSAIDKLASETISLLNGRQPDLGSADLQLAFNMQPLTGQQKMGVHLSQLMKGDIQCSMQALLVPAFHGLASSVVLEFEQAVELSAISSIMAQLADVQISEDPVSPMSHCQEDGRVFIYALQHTDADLKRLQFWIIADSFRNGLIKNYLHVMRLISKSQKDAR